VTLIYERENYDPESAEQLAESYFLKGQCLAELKNYSEAIFI
jgi:hypothetical protein